MDLLEPLKVGIKVLGWKIAMDLNLVGLYLNLVYISNLRFVLFLNLLCGFWFDFVLMVLVLQMKPYRLRVMLHSP